MKQASATQPRQTMRGHTEQVTDIEHLPGGRHIITCSSDGSLRLWDLESGVQIGNDWRDGGKKGLWSIALSPNGKSVASAYNDGKVRLWDVETKKVVVRWTGHADAVWSLCWSIDGERLVSGSHDGTIRVWDVKSGDTVLGPINTGHHYVLAVIYSPDTKKIATGGEDEDALKIWDAKTGNLLSTIKQNRPVFSLAWTSDQKKLICSDASIRIFDTATWQQIAILEGHTQTVYALSLFQNDRLLASASGDRTARLWNLDTNLQVGPSLQHERLVRSAAISADGKQLVTVCDDENAYVWDIHTTLKDAGLEDLLSIQDVNTSTSVWSDTDNVNTQIPQDHSHESQVTARKSLMDVRDPLATLGHECNC